MSSASRDSFFATKRTALFLYSVLVVLPALVFGGLHWHTLITEHRRQLAEAPEDAKSATARMLGGIKSRLKAAIDIEEARDFREYQIDHYTEGTTGEIAFTPSGFRKHPEQDKVEAWFAYDLRQESPEVTMFDGRHSEWLVEREKLAQFVQTRLIDERGEQLRPDLLEESPPNRDPSLAADRTTTQSLPVSVLALNLSPVRDLDRLIEDLDQLGALGDEKVDVPRTSFRMRMTRDGDDVRVFGTRQVLVRAQRGEFPEDFENLARDKVLVQGFFLRPEWLLRTMPREVINGIMDTQQRILFPRGLGGRESRRLDQEESEVKPTDDVREIQLFDEIDIDVEPETLRQYGLLKSVINLGEMKERFFLQWLGFASVTIVMAVSLAIGMGLLVRSVRASLEQARRTENFVASVTHELRTPIAAVKMYGEMLRDGWVPNEEKRNEYFQRIVRESDRLATLIDRVLLKRKLGVETVAPEPGDLNDIIRSQAAELESSGTRDGDLAFELEEDLPPVLLVNEGVHSILVNLVENARKYAPVAQPVGSNGNSQPEPILVRTYLSKGKVVLEVSDRGPGIPEAERSKIFDAFYRIGDERTRTTPGTGLGLHLVYIQARGMKARVQVADRQGGGATFRIAFKTLARTRSTALERPGPARNGVRDQTA